MCLGQFSPSDPRCINYNMEYCYFCGVKLGEKWDTRENEDNHKEGCLMLFLKRDIYPGE